MQRDVTSDPRLPRYPGCLLPSRSAILVIALVSSAPPPPRHLIGWPPGPASDWLLGWLVLFVWLGGERGGEVVTVTLQGGLSSQTTSHLPTAHSPATALCFIRQFYSNISTDNFQHITHLVWSSTILMHILMHFLSYHI